VKRIVPILLVATAACSGPQPPKDNVISKSATLAAWTSNGKVVYTEEVDTGPVRHGVFLFSPSSGKTEEIAVVFGAPTFLDADDTDRILLGGIGGAFTILKQDGTLLHEVTSLSGLGGGGYLGLHLAASGTKLALATLQTQPDLQVHSVIDGSLLFQYPDVEGTAVIRELEWSAEDSFLYYSLGDSTGTSPDTIHRVLSDSVSAPALVFEDAQIPRIDRLYLSSDGTTFVFSGEDADDEMGVWTVPASGGTAVRVAREDSRRLSVRAASGPSPDGERFVLLSDTARGTRLTVEPLEAIE
jgi:hypothetical protein